MRLFACAPAMDNNAKGVPTSRNTLLQVKEQKTVGETMQLIVNDLLTAREDLKHDSLKIGYSPYYQRSERCHTSQLLRSHPHRGIESLPLDG